MLRKNTAAIYTSVSYTHLDVYKRQLMGLGKKELERFIEEKENVECECSFCGSKYSFDINQLQEMISTINDIKK